jgi:serine/threonine protein phosphatase PrpC
MVNTDQTQPIKIVMPPGEPANVQATGKDFTLISASLSDVGKVRKLNEDACVEMPEKRLWVVADGMGGHYAGEVASALIIDSMQNVQHAGSFSSFVDEVEDVMIAANEQLCHLGKENGKIAGSTVVAMLIHHRHALVMWAGDSRAYLLRQNNLTQLTRDHSVVQELMELGGIRPEEAATHPNANVITRAVGANQNLYLDMDILEIEDDDYLLLCTDGLYRELTEEEIRTILNRHDSPAKAVQRMIALALSRGARDNITGIVLKAEAHV